MAGKVVGFLRGEEHVLQYQLFSLAVTGMVLRLRVSAIHRLVETRYSLEHDVLADADERRGAEVVEGVQARLAKLSLPGIFTHLTCTFGFVTGTPERERLVYKLSLHVVRQVLADFAWLEERGLDLVPVSINLSRADFLECDMVTEISKLVDASGFSRSLISIEITESAFVDSIDLLKREVCRFREAGFSVWMDDFGSEYSTLNVLQELDFDLVKLDMQFMRNFSTSGRNGIIVSDVIDMCRRKGMATLVEGVEERTQQEALRDMGSDKLQGYLFSKPRELSELVGEGE